MKSLRHHLGFLALLLALLSFGAPVAAYTDIAPGLPTVMSSSEDYNIRRQISPYVPASNSFDDGPVSYYLVTHDPALATATSVTYTGTDPTRHGNSYPLQGVILLAGGSNLHTEGVFHAATPGNRTYFFTAGSYHNPNPTSYGDYSRPNTSYVGLEPGVVFTKAPDGAYMERNQLQHPGLYFENIRFDGQGIDMEGKDDPTEGHRGFYYFMVEGDTAGLVMRDLQIANVGSSNISWPGVLRKNVAINVYRSTGPHHFENISFENIKTQGSFLSGYGILSFNQSQGCYLKGLYFDGLGMHQVAHSIKVETSHKNTDFIPLEANTVYFDQIHFPGTAPVQPNYIYVEDYRYHHVNVPHDFRYVHYFVQNGSHHTPAGRIYQGMPAADSGWALYDLWDKSWVILEGQAKSVTEQFMDTLQAIEAGNEGLLQDKNVPPPKIKYVADGGEIDGFSMAYHLLFGQSKVMGSEVPIEIVAVQSPDDHITSTQLVDVKADASFHLQTPQNRVILSNFNFGRLAHLTLQEAVYGVSGTAPLSDPNETGTSIPGYPLYASYAPATPVPPRVTGEGLADPSVNPALSFRNGRFMTLGQSLAWTGPPAPAILPLNQSFQVQASLATDYTAEGAAFSGVINDTAVSYYSSDPAVATVDLSSGVLRPVAEGTVQIYAKANDQFNQGEIERPWAVLSLTIGPALSVSTETGEGPSLVPTPSFFTVPSTPLPIPSQRPTQSAYPRLPATGALEGADLMAWSLWILLAGLVLGRKNK